MAEDKMMFYIVAIVAVVAIFGMVFMAIGDVNIAAAGDSAGQASRALVPTQKEIAVAQVEAARIKLASLETSGISEVSRLELNRATALIEEVPSVEKLDEASTILEKVLEDVTLSASQKLAVRTAVRTLISASLFLEDSEALNKVSADSAGQAYVSPPMPPKYKAWGWGVK